MAEDSNLMPEPINILQSFTDATLGRSLQLFYGVNSRMQTVGMAWYLKKEAGTSYSAYTEYSSTSGGMTINFDITINKPTVVAGVGYVDFTYQEGAAGAHTIGIVTFSICHVAGAAETVLGSATAYQISGGTSVSTVPITCTRKMFGVGSQLRLKAYIEDVGAGQAGAWIRLYHNPKTAGQELEVWVPIVNLE